MPADHGVPKYPPRSVPIYTRPIVTEWLVALSYWSHKTKFLTWQAWLKKAQQDDERNDKNLHLETIFLKPWEDKSFSELHPLRQLSVGHLTFDDFLRREIKRRRNEPTQNKWENKLKCFFNSNFRLLFFQLSSNWAELPCSTGVLLLAIVRQSLRKWILRMYARTRFATVTQPPGRVEGGSRCV